MVYLVYGTVDGRYEDCEHRAFHIQAIKNSGAKIMISNFKFAKVEKAESGKCESAKVRKCDTPHA